MVYPVLKSSNSWFDATKASRPDFKIIRIVDSYSATGNETAKWNADEGDNGDIICYVIGTELIIAGNGSGMIAANEDSSFMFSASVGTSDILNNTMKSFRNVTHIYGAELLDMSRVKLLNRAFAYDSSLEYIDVSTWDTSNVTTLEYTFGSPFEYQGVSVGGMKLKQLDVSKWNVGKVTSFRNAFLSNTELTILDTRNWDMTSAIDISSIFRDCSGLERLYVEDWVMPNLEKMGTIATNCSSVKALDFRRWNNKSVSAANKESAFNGMTGLEKITIGPNFTFGNGYPPTPKSEFIDGADGKWHTIGGSDYAPAEVPSGDIHLTIYAAASLAEAVREIPVILNGETAADIANAVRELTGYQGDLKPTEWAAEIRNR
jgi:surface protein